MAAVRHIGFVGGAMGLPPEKIRHDRLSSLQVSRVLVCFVVVQA